MTLGDVLHKRGGLQRTAPSGDSLKNPKLNWSFSVFEKQVAVFVLSNIEIKRFKLESLILAQSER